MISQRFFSFVMVILLPLLSWSQSGAIQSVTIGKQVWMTRNLDVSTFRNGDPIPEAKSDAEWEKAGQEGRPAWCYYDNNPANGAKYGKLYNWYAVRDPRGLAPKVWHIPSDKEWTVLTDYLGGKEKAGAKMKAKQGWAEDGNGTNSSGFSGLPGGHRAGNNIFSVIDNYGFWWSSTESNTYGAWPRSLYNSRSVGRDDCSKAYGLSVRCLRD